LDDAEFGALRDAVAVLATIDSEPLHTTFTLDPDRTWRWSSANVSPPATLIAGDLAPVIVDAIAPICVAAEFGHVLSLEPQRDTFTGGITGRGVADRFRPELRQAVVRLLAEIMPKGDGAETPPIAARK
jgi:hypothetical protein